MVICHFIFQLRRLYYQWVHLYMHEDDVTDGYTANLHFGTSFFNQFNSPEVDLLSELTPRSNDFNSTNAENSVSF